MLQLTTKEKELLSALSETEDWIKLTEHIETIVIENLKTKDVWYVELINIGGDIISQCSEEISAAFTGSTNIPSEWKSASMDDIISFIIKVLINQGKIIGSIFLSNPTK